MTEFWIAKVRGLAKRDVWDDWCASGADLEVAS